MTNPDFPDRRQGGAAGGDGTRTSAGQLLIALRRHRIPCSIDSLSADGWTARLGEPGNGLYAQQGRFRTRDDAAAWLRAEVERRVR